MIFLERAKGFEPSTRCALGPAFQCHNDEIQVASSEIGSNLLHAFDIALGKTIVDRDILPLDEAPSIKPALKCSIRCGHVLLTTEKIRTLVDNIRGKKDRIIEGEVVKKGDDDG